MTFVVCQIGWKNVDRWDILLLQDSIPMNSGTSFRHLAELRSDGDGDFRPRFDIGIDFNTKDGIGREKILGKCEIMWDAG